MIYIFEENGVRLIKWKSFSVSMSRISLPAYPDGSKKKPTDFRKCRGSRSCCVVGFSMHAIIGGGTRWGQEHGERRRGIRCGRICRVMVRKMKMLLDYWTKNLPTIRFFTPLPNIGETFITGDHPVVVQLINENLIWEPTSRPVQGITNLTRFSNIPKHLFMLALSPYVCACVVRGEPEKVHLPPKTVDLKDVREFNNWIRQQCNIFTLARDRSSLG